MLGWRVTLLLLSAGAQAQSGDGGADGEPRISCSSHIATEENSLTCQLLSGGADHEDDEDEGDSIEKMTLCYTDLSSEQPHQTWCEEDDGNLIRIRAKPVVDFNLTVDLRRGGRISTMVDLRKIVKPRPPQVSNVTFSWETHQVLIHIQTPYNKDYLKVDNQLFQLHIWAADSHMIQNVSLEDTLRIDMEHLKTNTQYYVAVRSIPAKVFQGSWSEWSEKLKFFIPAEGNVLVASDQRYDVAYRLLVCLVLAVLLTLSVIFFWKYRLFSLMWPNIPRPKDTLVHICKPNKGLLLNFSPEEFSSLRVCPVEKVRPCEDPEPSVSPDRSQSSDPCSTQSSDCRSTTSISTEELELSALLSWTSSEGGSSLQSTSPSPINVPQQGGGPQTPAPPTQHNGGGNEVFEVNPQEEAYVTMSSFYQIK